jgi:hypothetical protein
LNIGYLLKVQVSGEAGAAKRDWVSGKLTKKPDEDLIGGRFDDCRVFCD